MQWNLGNMDARHWACCWSSEEPCYREDVTKGGSLLFSKEGGGWPLVRTTGRPVGDGRWGHSLNESWGGGCPALQDSWACGSFLGCFQQWIIGSCLERVQCDEKQIQGSAYLWISHFLYQTIQALFQALLLYAQAFHEEMFVIADRGWATQGFGLFYRNLPGLLNFFGFLLGRQLIAQGIT